MNSYFKASFFTCSTQCVICIVSLLFLIYQAQAQCPEADLTSPETVCIDENFNIINNNTNAVSYEWDFCLGDVFQIPKQNTVLDSEILGRISSIDMVISNGIWYGFAVDIRLGNIIRLKFVEGLESVPTIENLGNFNLFNRPVDIDVLNDNGNWLAVVADLDGSTLGLLNFGNSLENIASSKNLGNFGVLNQPRSLEIANDNGNWIGVVSNRESNKVTLINWGASILNSTGVQIINNNLGYTLMNILGLDIIKTKTGWYGLTCSSSTGRVFRLEFGNNLFNRPTATLLATNLASPTGVNIIEEEGRYVGFVSGYSGQLYRFNFNGNVKNDAVPIDVGGAINLARRYNFNLIQNKGALHLFSVDLESNRLDKLIFQRLCNQSIDFSEETEPEMTYFSSGTKSVKLSMINDDCKVDSTFNIQVGENIAPSLDLELGEVCEGSTTQITFTTENPENIVSQNWTIENATFSEDTVNYSFPSPGTYPVTLEVESADGCGQRLTKDITIYEPPEPKFVVDKEVICTNGEIAFQNLTDTNGADEIISYQWNFNGEGSSTEANPGFTFTTGGSKTVSLTASIPGCSNTYDTTFVVEQGPIVNFNTPPQICQGDEVTFENLTSGENITGYSWNFGDGGTYASTALDNPSYAYDSAGTYIATLEVNNENGCANTLSKTITIYARPQAAFTADIACAGAPTQFADESSTGINSNIVGWNWDFGDGMGTSTVRNPQYTYNLPGVYEASLIVLTSAGCTDTLVQEIMVESAVQADFNEQALCTGEAEPYTVRFTDESSVTDGQQITEWLWTINGENFVIANPSYVFEAPGTYQVSLTVFSETACNASITKNITIATPPTPDFSFTPNCAGGPVSFNNLSLSEEVEISQYLWDFGGMGISYDENPSFVFEEAGTYEVSLTLETATACKYTISREVIIPAAPQAGFDTDVSYGGAPLTVNFTNTSIDGTSYLWNFGGEENNSEESPTYTFTEPGVYVVSLEVEGELGATALGCKDTFSQEIRVVEPVTDLQLQKISILSDEGDPNVRMLLTIHNRGTLNMSGFDIAITLDEVLSIHETYEGTIEQGKVVNYPLDFTVSAQQNRNIDLRYICVMLEELTEDVNLMNNRACISLNNNFTVVSPYPNPSGDKIKLDIVLPRQEVVNLSLISMRGEILQKQTINDTKVGLNSFSMDVSTMTTGNYILQVDYLDHTETHRLMVNP